MTLIRSEYWIQDGNVVECGNDSDMNHEGHAIQTARSMLLDELGVSRKGQDDEGIDDDRLEEAIIEYYFAEVSETEKETGEEEMEEAFQHLLAAAEDKPKLQALWDCAHDIGDAREWAQEYMGWKRVHGDNIDTHTLTRADFDEIASGVLDIIGEVDLIPHDDDEDPEAETLGIYVTVARKHYTIRLIDLMEGNYDGCFQREEIETLCGPNSQLRQMEIDSQHPYYGNKLGD